MSVVEFFEGKTIFMTGGTGFVGKVLLEKLLRSCPGIRRVYLTVREKKGLSPQQRWEKISAIPLFDRLKKERPEAIKKVVLIPADMKRLDLGISETDRQTLIKEVNLVYHAAATVQFADNVIDTLTKNTRAIYSMLELAKEIENLVLFVYVSTTYSNYFRPEENWDEKVYPAVQDWRVLLRLMDTEPLHLAMLKERLLCGHPNPYTFSKSLAEQIVYDYRLELPTLIVRPSVVMASIHEPMPGWVDSLNGMAALCLANSLGILRVAHHSSEAHQDYVPVDYAANGIIVATTKAQKKNKEELPMVINCTAGKMFTMRTSEVSVICDRCQFVEQWPSKYIVWTRDLRLIENKYKYYFLFIIYQLIPACILDTGMYLSGNKPLFIQIAQKLANASERLFKNFSFRKVHFPNDNYISMLTSLEGEDLELFGSKELIDRSAYDIEEILKNTYIGTIKYFLKEDLSEKTLERNKKRFKRIQLASKTLNVIWYSTYVYIAYRLINMLPLVNIYHKTVDAISF